MKALLIFAFLAYWLLWLLSAFSIEAAGLSRHVLIAPAILGITLLYPVVFYSDRSQSHESGKYDTCLCVVCCNVRDAKAARELQERF